MDPQAHWDKLYRDNAPDHVRWYRPHLEASLALIEHTGAGPSTSIIDVGAGESTLVDDLLARSYSNLTVLDISHAAIAATKKRLGDAAGRVRWLIGNITKAEFQPAVYDVWHDRAVFHFLTSVAERSAYVR